MDKNSSQLWQSVLGQLEISISGANYSTFIKTLTPKSVSETEIVLYTTNFMSKSYVESKFLPTILEAVQSVKPSIDTIRLIVSKNESKLVDSTPIQNENTKQVRKKESSTPTQRSTSSPAPKNKIQHNYTFSNFIIGSGNQVAFSAAQLVIEKPGEAYNPLFLYGPAGVGKTHLMWAISNEIAVRQPDFNILYITSEQFYNEFINTVRHGGKFTSKYREVDVLLIDDMQFIAGKEKTQEEFFHIFNALHQNAKQIVLCSDCPPKDIPTLEERLRSRFEWGMVADISPPDLETRVAIVLNKADSQSVKVSQEVAEYIAGSATKNIRELEGALKKLIVYSSAHNSQIDIDLATRVLGSNTNDTSHSINSSILLEKTAAFYNISLSDILSVKRDKDIAIPRQIVMYLMRSELNLSYPKIAKSLGGKDHTTIMYGHKKIEKKHTTEPEFQKEISRLKEYIYS